MSRARAKGVFELIEQLIRNYRAAFHACNRRTDLIVYLFLLAAARANAAWNGFTAALRHGQGHLACVCMIRTPVNALQAEKSGHQTSAGPEKWGRWVGDAVAS